MSQTPEKERVLEEENQQELLEVDEEPERSGKGANILTIILLIFLTGALVFAGAFKLGLVPDASPTAANPGILPPPIVPSGADVPVSVNMGMPGGKSITTLQPPTTSAHMKNFTLVAQNKVISLGGGVRIPAWTFNGVAPGPTLRVQQGDLVVVNVVNKLSFGITIHWHGIDVANSQDGVAGTTQDAIKPGQTYTYRFVVNDPGTYWYHSHQLAEAETIGGLFGVLIVDPAKPTIAADVDYSIALHEWNGSDNQTFFTFNDTLGTLKQAAKPGQWVRLRITETSNTASTVPRLLTLVGAPFKVISLDGHDLNKPSWLDEVPIPIGTGQRYDLLFQMPSQGSVSLVAADVQSSQRYLPTPALVLGQGSVPAQLPSVKPWFDLTTYGQPAPSPITPQSKFDITYGIILSNQVGTSLGRKGMTYTINGKVFPDTDMLMVKEGQLVRLHFDNQSDLYHPMHLHGHSFIVLTKDGKPLTGSPVRLDTVLVPPHSTYDVAFLANNPGIWMVHCHNFLHANWGMDMMLMYEGYSTPYNVGTASGNFPD